VKSRLLALLTLLAFLPAAVAAFFWHRSYHSFWELEYISTISPGQQRLIGIGYNNGNFVLGAVTIFIDPANPRGVGLHVFRGSLTPTPGYQPQTHLPGLRFWNNHYARVPHAIGLAVSGWILLPMLLVLPIPLLLPRWRRHRRAALNLCLTCGYDLRVQLAAHSTQDSPLSTSTKCPECGSPIPTPSIRSLP